VHPPQILEGAALPPDVRDLPEPPARLYLHGNAPRGPRVAIVGTRRPTDEALAYAEGLARHLAERGVAILSGGAKGIDAGAHRGALQASGVTLVVAPSGFDRPYPAEHRGLFEQILAGGGGYLSHLPAGVEPRRHQFFERNALLAALCHALVMVEAPLRSGARNAAAWARRLGRACFVVPAPPWNQRGRGCIAELQLGARPLGGPEDVLRWLDGHLGCAARPARLEPGGEPLLAAPALAAEPSRRRLRRRSVPPAQPAALAAAPGRAPPEDPTCAAVLRALEGGARYPEQLADALSGVSLAELNHAILTLLLKGLVARSADGELTVTRR
jgi:DNA processing protein